MPTPAEYSIEAPSSNLRDLLPDVAAPWSLSERLAIARERNHQYSTGAGARRRSSYEHQLDRHLALLRAADCQGAAVRVRGAGELRPWELLHGPLAGRAPAVRVYRHRILALIAWCRENDPVRVGWALRQSAPRARRAETATELYLPRRSWRAFTAWRRVVRQVGRLLAVLATWWETLIPAPRASSPRTEDEERTRGHGRVGEAGTWYRDQPARGGAPAALHALLGHAM